VPAEKTKINRIIGSDHFIFSQSTPLIGVVIRKLSASNRFRHGHYRQMSEVDIERLKVVVAKACDYLSKKGKIVFIPMNIKEPDDDRQMAKEITKHMEYGQEAIIIGKSYRPSEMMGLLNQCEFILANRVHTIILASTCGVPFVSIAYDLKFIGIAERFHMKKYNLDLVGIEYSKLIKQIDDVWENRVKIGEDLKMLVSNLKELNEITANFAIRLSLRKPIPMNRYEKYFV
jgi:polysaccharide pyruvyl transferase WcaK-like protein